MLHNKKFYYATFTEEETRFWRVICQRPHCWWAAGLNSKSTPPTLELRLPFFKSLGIAQYSLTTWYASTKRKLVLDEYQPTLFISPLTDASDQTRNAIFEKWTLATSVPSFPALSEKILLTCTYNKTSARLSHQLLQLEWASEQVPVLSMGCQMPTSCCRSTDFWWVTYHR